MPSLGSISTSCVPWATVEVQAFACRLKTLIPRLRPGSTVAEKARALHVSPSLLSHWLNGRRLPRPAALSEMAALAAEGVSAHEEEVALRREFTQLGELLREARRSSCRRCEGSCRCRRATTEGDRRNGPTGSDAATGDRRNSSPRTIAASTSADGGSGFLDRLAALPPADRASLLWKLGATWGEREAGRAIKVLADKRMHSEVEIILRSAEAAGRDPVRIALTLSGCG
ncbi:helix-turn-helix domain-containing protein [Streptomyces sp. SID8374]|uniref:helix-turn-helix domain-containing protein n=1 Tax=Streptomyces sp. SID8374 TaxID=2690354 RepID=UPI00136BBDB1|nr:helix-turn-helix transcriptional regulator [Streptomyces sp. SID8374]MYX13939.1 helix-turn-helix domain-containing protein [Streptomyces sp. SID8374]